MVAINDLWAVRGEILDDAPAVRKRMSDATANEMGMIILTGQGNTANAVKERIKLMRNIFRPE